MSFFYWWLLDKHRSRSHTASVFIQNRLTRLLSGATEMCAPCRLEIKSAIHGDAKQPSMARAKRAQLAVYSGREGGMAYFLSLSVACVEGGEQCFSLSALHCTVK